MQVKFMVQFCTSKGKVVDVVKASTKHLIEEIGEKYEQYYSVIKYWKKDTTGRGWVLTNETKLTK